MKKDEPIIVIGAGIAGIAATITLIKKGLNVILIEKKMNIGGRAFSFKHLKSLENIDNGQHIFTQNCNKYISLLKDLNVLDKVILEKSINVPVYKNNKRSNLKFSTKLIPISLFLGLLKYKHISFFGKFRIIYALLIIKFKNYSQDLDNQDFKTWLNNHHQNHETQKYFWELFLKPALNDELSSISSYIAIMTIKNSVLKPRKTAFGLPKVDLTSLVEYNFKKILKKTNSQLILGTSVKKFIEEKNKIKKIELSDKKEMKVNSIISTIPFYELKHFEQTSQKMVSIFNKISQLESAPIVCVHFWFSKKVTDDLYFSVLDSPIQWVFNVSKIRGSKTQKNQHLVISLSSAWEWIKHDREEMISLFSKEIFKLLKIDSNIKINQTLIVNQPNATFRSLPGSLNLRSKNITSFSNFFLAGDWTNTGWPSTMESAAISGINSAEKLLKYLKLQ